MYIMPITPYEQKAVQKVERLEARLSSEQKALFQHAADLQGRSLTDFVISSLQDAAKKVIREHGIIKLTPEGQKFFVEALLKPKKPNKNLRLAAKRHDKEVE